MSVGLELVVGWSFPSASVPLENQVTEINNVQIARKLKCIPKKYRSEFFNKPWGGTHPPLPGVLEPSGESPLNLRLILLTRVSMSLRDA